MAKVQILENYCKSCRLCITACPRDVLKIGDKVNASGYEVAEMKENALNVAKENNFAANADAHFTNAKDTLLQDNAKLAGKTKKLARKANKMGISARCFVCR